MAENRLLTALLGDRQALQALVPGTDIVGFPATPVAAVTSPIITSAAIMLTCTAAAHIKFSTAGTAAVTTDFLLPAGFYVFPIIPGRDNRVSVIDSAAGAGTVYMVEGQSL